MKSYKIDNVIIGNNNYYTELNILSECIAHESAPYQWFVVSTLSEDFHLKDPLYHLYDCVSEVWLHL